MIKDFFRKKFNINELYISVVSVARYEMSGNREIVARTPVKMVCVKRIQNADEIYSSFKYIDVLSGEKYKTLGGESEQGMMYLDARNYLAPLSTLLENNNKTITKTELERLVELSNKKTNNGKLIYEILSDKYEKEDNELILN